METLADRSIGDWMGTHGHVCWILFSLLVLPMLHLYLQTHWVRKAIHMRKGGDGVWRFGKPRPKPHRPELRALPEDPQEARTPKD